MFEITYRDTEVFESYRDLERVPKNGVYDFTFENRFIIFHAPECNRVDYIAIDMTTMLGSLVISKQPGNLYTKGSYRKLIPHILFAVKYTGDRRYLSRFQDDPMDIIDAIFRIVLPNNGYSIREEQIDLAKKMYEGFTGKQVSLCEAEVGTGKTLAYLVAGLVAKYRNLRFYGESLPVTITTSSIELQKALVEKEIPNLSRMLMDYYIIEKPLTAALRKGKEHYFCQYRYEDFLRNIRKYPVKYKEMIAAMEQFGALNHGIDLDKHKLNGKIKSRICVKGSCTGCPYFQDCGYRQYIQSMFRHQDLDFQVTNHNLYLMSQKSRFDDDHPTLLRRSCFVVVDEAHKFREAATDIFGERINEKDILRYVNGVKLLCGFPNSKTLYNDCLNRLIALNSELFDGLRIQRYAGDLDEDRGSIISLSALQIAKLTRMASLIEKIETMKKHSFGVAVTGAILLDGIKAMVKKSKSLLWLDTDENGEITLCATPKDIHSILYQKVWNQNVSHVLTSGTISDGTDFDYFKSENGIDQIPDRLLLESRTESPFDYEHHARLYIPAWMPMPDNSDTRYFTVLADKIHQIIEATNGHTAILFTSYKALTFVYDLLKDRLGKYEVFTMTRSNKTAIADFKKSKNGILFASGSMWEGVDCVGDILSSVIIVRLPFPMRSVLMDEKKESYGSVAEFVEKSCTPNMLIKLRQGVGRLIRSESDTGVVSILDPRANGMSYAVRVDQALSKFPRVDSVEEIRTFIHSVKDERYFA